MCSPPKVQQVLKEEVMTRMRAVFAFYHGEAFSPHTLMRNLARNSCSCFIFAWFDSTMDQPSFFVYFFNSRRRQRWLGKLLKSALFILSFDA